jgi:hypothetical protein
MLPRLYGRQSERRVNVRRISVADQDCAGTPAVLAQGAILQEMNHRTSGEALCQSMPHSGLIMSRPGTHYNRFL